MHDSVVSAASFTSRVQRRDVQALHFAVTFAANKIVLCHIGKELCNGARKQRYFFNIIHTYTEREERGGGREELYNVKKCEKDKEIAVK